MKEWFQRRKCLLVFSTLLLAWSAAHGIVNAANQKAPQKLARHPFRILFIGDSITSYGVSPQSIKTLGWNHASGMAATSASKDYVHLLTAFIQKALPHRKVTMQIGAGPDYGRFDKKGGRNVHIYLAPMKLFVKRHPLSRYNLIVLQHGEHEQFRRGLPEMRRICSAWMKLFSGKHRAMMICVGPWAPWFATHGKKYTGWTLRVQHTIRRLCLQWGGVFVSVEDIAVDPRNHGWGKAPGVRWHPNDRGHLLYAIQIFKAFKKIAAAHGLILHPVVLPKVKP